MGAKQRKDGYVEGNDYIVSWCVGHLVGLADAFDYNEKYGKWRREDLPIMPDTWKHTIFDDKKKQFNTLRRLMNHKDVESLVCATDAGREGELIFRFVYQMAGCTKPFSRLWISSMEERAIKAGFANLKDGSEYDPLYHSANCRAKADWLVGINATRLFSTLYGKTLNVGRVQTPTLALLIERQQQISGFIKEKYYKVNLDLGGVEASSEHIQDPQEATKIQTACHNRRAVCHSIIRELKTVTPPKLFDLTALQRESNRMFGYTAQQTLTAAQKLYEAKLITYPRTDSRYITTDMAAKIPALVQAAVGLTAISAPQTINAERLVNDEKVSDHHAIIPTLGKSASLSSTESSILSLIAVRLLCAVASEHIYEKVTAIFDCNGYSFTAKGKVIIAEGWKSLTNSTENSSALPPLIQGQVFQVTAAKATDHYTQPPKSHTEATLLSAMESAGAGLGTPATRAAVIEKLVRSGFVTRSERQLIPTPDGEKLIKILPASLKSPALTAEWENALTQIAQGKTRPENFMRSINEMVRMLVSQHTVREENL